MYPCYFPKFIKDACLKVCHLSAFQTVSRRSVYIKNINDSGSTLATLNNTMQTNSMQRKKTKLIFKYKQDLLGTTFLWGKDL